MDLIGYRCKGCGLVIVIDAADHAPEEMPLNGDEFSPAERQAIWGRPELAEQTGDLILMSWDCRLCHLASAFVRINIVLGHHLFL